MMQLIHCVLIFSLRTQKTTNAATVKVIKQINHFSTCILRLELYL